MPDAGAQPADGSATRTGAPRCTRERVRKAMARRRLMENTSLGDAGIWATADSGGGEEAWLAASSRPGRAKGSSGERGGIPTGGGGLMTVWGRGGACGNGNEVAGEGEAEEANASVCPSIEPESESPDASPRGLGKGVQKGSLGAASSPGEWSAVRPPCVKKAFANVQNGFGDWARKNQGKKLQHHLAVFHPQALKTKRHHVR